MDSNASFPRGSEWRKWDLHVHSPRSELHHEFGDDFDVYAKTLFERAVQNEIAVIGITDYFTIDGYKELRQLQSDSNRMKQLLGDEVAEAALRIRLLPNIELRLDVFIRVGDKESRVNAHVIFSDDVSEQSIEENFLQQLKFISEASPGGFDDERSLTTSNLTELGSRLKKEHDRFSSLGDLRVGMMQACVGHHEISEILVKNSAFRGRALFVIEADEDLSEISWDSQAHNTRKVLFQKSHMFFSPNSGTRSFALGERHGSGGDFLKEFKTRKPCIHGSDAHRLDTLFVFAEDRQLWIKADPTFEGLRQLCLEPDSRVFIGPEPPEIQRVRVASTKSVESVTFQREVAAGNDAKWFSGEVPLNSGLVAIIGKKGSGKSALADVIGLVEDAKTHADFSFLNRKRFLNPKQNLGQHFTATVKWRSGDTDSRRLDEGVNDEIPERVRHLPQNYLERICVEIQESSSPTLFDRELENVIFSHVPQSDRLGRTSLAELVAHTSEQTAAKIALLRKRLSQVNREYTTLRRENAQEAKTRLSAELQQREAALKALKAAKPAKVKDPNEGESAGQASTGSNTELDEVVTRIEGLDLKAKAHREREAKLKQKVAAIDRLRGRIENLASTVEDFFDQSADDAALLEMDPKELVKLVDDLPQLDEARRALIEELDAIAIALDEHAVGSDAALRAAASKTADGLRKQLAEPQRRYQEYKRSVARWQKQILDLEGTPEDPDSIKGLQVRLEAFKAIPELAAAKREERFEIVDQIFAAKTELLESYRKLYKPVQDFIAHDDFDTEIDDLSFAAEIAVDGLEDGLLRLIHQGRKGSFQGEAEGRARLRALIQMSDFSTTDGVKKFLTAIADHFSHDVRSDEAAATKLEEQLVGGVSVEDVYDFVFGLGYLEPRYRLLWRDKSLDQLSPGERGTLLLIFYLLIDREDIPLLIDQPEENLDNETVAQLLVPAVKNAKERRQIVMVTHNPNLAVVCDADQIVHADIDKADGNRVRYTSGSLENPEINQLVVDVLEGTKPAFDLRGGKYEVLDRIA